MDLEARSSRQIRIGRPPTHGLTKTPEFRTWTGMMTRCRNANSQDYDRYGGRGITICERWNQFENFLADMGIRPSMSHSIDRIDTNGNYEPGNCRWATQTEQSRNQRTNKIITIGDKRQCVAAWAEELGIKPDTLRKRLAHGIAITRALNMPVISAGEQVKARARNRTHCPQGHEWNEANTYHGKGGRQCRACKRERRLLNAANIRNLDQSISQHSF